MSAQVTVTLAEDVLERANLLAARTGRPVADLLAETIELSLQPLGSSAVEQPLTESSDEQVSLAADASLADETDRRLSVLLDRQQAGLLDADERVELMSLMQLYQEGLLRKACALREAVRRGLRKPIQP